MAHKNSKTIHEAFSRFFEKPTRESFRTLLREHVGELRNCDFKEDWPEHSALAKHLLALGNTGGGCIIFGVKENEDKTTTPQGLKKIIDKADIFNGVKSFLPEPLFASLEVADFSYEASEYSVLVGKLFQVVFVHDHAVSLPLISTKSGAGIRAGAIYMRREGQSEEAMYAEVQRLIDRRIDASPQTTEARNLKEHLEELKVLYAEIPRHLSATGSILGPLQRDIQRFAQLLAGESSPNPRYPEEDYQSFVRQLLDGKKVLIEGLTGVKRKQKQKP